MKKLLIFTLWVLHVPALIKAQGCTPTQPLPIIGPIEVCAGQPYTYKIHPVSASPPVQYYEWQKPSSWNFFTNPNLPSITVVPSPFSGQLRVRAVNSCGPGPWQVISITCYTPPAQPGTITGPSPVCTNLSPVFSVVNDPNIAQYNWTAPSQWQGNTTVNPYAPTNVGVSGVLSVSGSNACGVTPAQALNVSVETPPAAPAPVTGPQNPCVGAAVQYNAAAISNATGYSWTMPGSGTPIAGTNVFNGTAGSIFGPITVVAQNVCGNSAPASLNISPMAVPSLPPPINGPVNPCTYATGIQYSISGAGPGTTAWIVPSGWVITNTSISGDAITVDVGTSPGQVQVTITNACGTSPVQVLNVSPMSAPVAPSYITGPQSACEGTGAQFSVPAVNGATGYTWNFPSGWTVQAPSNGNSVNAVVGNQGGVVTVTADNVCGSSAAVSMNVSASPLPTTPSQPNGPVNPCEGDIVLYSTGGSLNSTQYSWSFPSGWIVQPYTQTANMYVQVGSQSGVISVTGVNSCGSSAPANINVQPVLLPAMPSWISGPLTPCQGDTVSYSIPPVSGATSYAWNIPPGWTILGGTTGNSIQIIVGQQTGNLVVTAINSCGSTIGPHVPVAPMQAPQLTQLLGPVSVCMGQVAFYSVNSNGTVDDFYWTIPPTWSSNHTVPTSDNFVAPTVVGSNGGVVSVYASNQCGNSNTLTVNVSQPLLPPLPPITGPAVVCDGSQQFYWINPGVSPASYNWSFPPSWTVNDHQDTQDVTVVGSGGIISVTVTGVCGDTQTQTMQVTTVSQPLQPVVSGPSAVCSGVQVTYVANPYDPTATYSWQFPTGWTLVSSNQNTLTVVPDGSNGYVLVNASNVCDVLNDYMQVLNNDPPQPGPISGPTLVCPSNNPMYFVSNTPGVSYTWTVPPTWQDVSSIPNSNAMFPLTGTSSGWVTVQAGTGCGSSAVQSLWVTVGTPPSSLPPITGPGAPCDDAMSLYSLPSVAGASSLNWGWPTGWIGSVSGGVLTLYPQAPGGVVSVTVTFACGGTLVQSLQVTPVTAPPQNLTVSGPFTVCPGGTVTYTAIAQSALSFNWTLPSGWTGSSNVYTIDVTAPSSGGGQISVTAGNVCGNSGPATIFVSVFNVDVSVGGVWPSLVANTSNSTYQWLDCNNGYAPIPGATQQNYNGSWNGNYAVQVTQNGCTDTSQCYNGGSSILVGGGSGTGIEVSPNPTSGQFVLTMKGGIQAVSYRVTNELGREVLSGEFRQARSEVFIEGQPGFYLLEVTTANGMRLYERVIKQD